MHRCKVVIEGLFESKNDNGLKKPISNSLATTVSTKFANFCLLFNFSAKISGDLTQIFKTHSGWRLL